ncbi:reverse transcriptase [Gossypium australe]|uniref:Reverse transcriptase n=1 Tax=Gossypium australe TaxID=47621 RepID=A0A5B6WWC6_9ROSI|nr:reverse transcriptase [Gossypium australe]
MDFVEVLLVSKGKDIILVVVDRLTKYGHFVALSHPFMAVTIAQEYLTHVYKLYGALKSIILDRGKIFLSTFWHELFRRLKTRLKLSIDYHFETNVLYGQAPLIHLPYLVGMSSIATLDRSLQHQQMLKFHFQRA